MSTVALAALVAAGSLAVVVAPAPAEAAVVEAFTVTYDDTIWGDYLLVGNSQLECITSGTTDRFDADNDGNTAEALGLVVDWTHYTDCQNDANRNSVGGDSPNDDRFMVFSRTDTGTAGIFNSSDVTITLPPGSSVDAAYLYWHGNDVQASGLGGGTATALNTADTIDSSPGAAPWPSCQATSTSTDWSSYGSSGGTASTTTITKRLRATFDAAAAGARSQMRIRVGAASSYQTITSSDEDLSPTDGHSGHLYQQEADVTSLLNSAPRGVPVTITGANISTGEGFGCTGAWALAIVYKYAARHATYAPDLRRVQLYDGFTEVSNTDTIATTLGGFLASGGGTVEPRAGFVAYEGDQQITGDAFQLEALTLEEPRLTPSGTTTNYWASTVGEFTTSTTGDFTRNPNWADAAGPDIKVVPISVGDLANAGDGVTATFTTSGDRYTPSVLVFSALDSVLSGHVYEDADADGVYDSGEVGIAGVTMQLTGTSVSSGAISRSTTTDADGVYVFQNVPEANASGYTVTQVHPTAYLDGTDHVGTAGGADGTLSAPDSITGIRHDLTVQSLDYDFGEIVPAAAASFAKTVYEGHDSGSGCATATETVTRPPGTSVTWCLRATNTGNARLASPTITDAALGIPSGSATLLSGTFPLTLGATAVWYVESTVPASTLTNSATFTANPVNPAGADLTGRADVSETDTAQAIVPARVSIGDKVFVDTDADGAQDGGEPGLAGALVELFDAAGTTPVTTDVFGDPVSSVTTLADGLYQFSDLAPGTYTVAVTPPGAYVETTSNAGSATEATDSDGLTAQTPNLAGGTTYTSQDAGVVQRGSISGEVFDDLDADGVHDGFETGIAGVTVTLSGTDLYGNPLLTAQSTAGDGTFAFTNVLPGTYTLTETQPAAYADGAQTIGSAGGSSAVNDVISGIGLGSATAATGYSFAEIPGTLAGVVFEDLDGDGALDVGEPGISGVTITLGGAATDTTTTDVDGAYYFPDLLAGTYTISETQPGGYTDGSDTVGSTGGSAAVNDVISGVTLAAGETATGYLFAEFQAGTLAGIVFEDRDGDGVRDAGEPGIGGVGIDLSGTATASTTTAGDGSYSFTGLAPGTYTITETQPASHADGTDTAGAGGGSTATDDVVSGIALASGASHGGYLFAELAGSLSGVVFEDLDGDGTQDVGEGGLLGVTVDLTGTETANTTTAADGTYSFPHLSVGTYTITETQPGAYADGSDTVGSTGGSAAVNDVISGITLAAGEAATGYTFAEFETVSIAGLVFEDRDGDGVQDVGEPGLLGVAIAAAGPTNSSTTTAADGSFVLSGLAPGTYTITESQPTSHGDGTHSAGTGGGSIAVNDVISGIALSSGTAVTGYEFAELPGSISGVVFDDLDGDGVRDGGEPGIGGVDVTLGGAATAATTTAGDGSYSFTHLVAGTYTITETQPAGYADGDETVGSTGGSAAVNDVISAVTLAGGEDATGYAFADYVLGSIAGVVFEDRDNDGTQDPGEPGLVGVAVDLGGTASGSTTTGADGSYAFTGLVPGTYGVTESQPASHADGTDTAGTLGGSTAVDDVISGIVLTSGDDGTGYTFAELPGSISGLVFDDVDGDGSHDVGEPGIAGVTIGLAGAATASTVTGAGGTYRFDDLAAGSYTLTETQPAGYADGSETVGSTGGSAAVNDVISAVTLAAGEDATGYQFAEFVSTSISGAVFEDRDGDGVRDPGEPGVAGVTITLGGDGSGTVVSGGDGSYTFLGLVPGTYTITQTQPTSHADGADTAGTNGGSTLTDDEITGIVLDSGDAATGCLFAELPGSIAGTIFDDLDGDGVLDLGEPGLAGVTVVLSGAASASTVTAGDGSYSFANLVAGTYTLTETQPAGYTDGAETAGTAGGSTAVNDVISGVVLAAGADATNYRFAEYVSVSITGSVFEDRDADGVQDAGEPGIAGVGVTLSGTASSSTVTGSDGSYAFTGLAPGTYTLTETHPVGYLDGAEHAGSRGGSTAANDVISGVTIASGQTATGYLFTEDTGSLRGVVFDDLDADGVLDAGEPGLLGVVLTLDDGATPSTATTDASGEFVFEGLLAGTYDVTEAQPSSRADWIDTAGTAGGTEIEPDLIAGIVLGAGDDATDYWFAEVEGRTIAGLVFDDADADGVLDAGEPGLVGVTVTVNGEDQRGEPVTASRTTDAMGLWSFDVLPGTYELSEDQPADHVDWIDTAGTQGGTAAEPDRIEGIVVPPGGDATGYWFAEVRPASVSGRVELVGENVGIEDVVVTLTGVDLRSESIEIVRTSGSDGSFAFEDLAPGEYELVQTQPSLFADGPETVGSAGGTVTGDDSMTGIVLATDQDATGYVFAEFLPDVRGRVFVDADVDGVRDECAGCDPPRADVTVRLLRAITSAVVGTTTTASDGTYLFTSVPAGDYVIEFAAPAGFSFVPADAGPDGFDSDVDATTGRTAVVALRGDVADLDAGLVLTPVDLALTISQSSARPKQGDTLTYTLDVTNDGPTTVYGPIRLVQQLPSGVTPVAAAGETWDCSITGSEVTCIRALALVPGEAAPPIVVTTTVIDSRGDLVSRASVGTPADELSLANNQVETMATMATQGGSLPFTGADTLRLILVAAGVLTLGLFLTYGPRRRVRPG